MLGRYDLGLSGEQGEATRGYDATTKLNDILGNTLTTQAGGAFNNAQQNIKNRGDVWSMFGKALGAGGGAIFGGVPGAKVGASLFGGR